MMSSPSSTNDDAYLNTMPAALIKNLRATACLKVYDFIFNLDSMKLSDMQKIAYNSFHGNDEKNISSQIELLLQGHGDYSRIYDEEVTIVTNPNATVDEVSSNKSRILKSIFCTSSDKTNMRFVSGTHFNKMSLSAPTKNKLTEKITGRNVLDLAKLALKNVKKAIVIAEEWLTDGELPSGRSYDDLYAHILSKYDDINPI